MKFITMSEGTLRFYWEQVVWANNLINLGVSPQDIIIVRTKGNPFYASNLRKLYGVQVYEFDADTNKDASAYVPSVKPYLWVQLLKHYPEMANDDYFVQDSDVIFREIPNFNKMPLSATTWYGSETESYTGPDYLNEKGSDFLTRIGAILEIDPNEFWKYKGHSVGAQWVISQPKLEYWEDVYDKSYKLYYATKLMEPEYLKRYKEEGRPKDYYFYQIWTAEMTATLYLTSKYGIIPNVSPELDFDWSSDKIEDVKDKHNKIIHNAGVTQELADSEHLFFKGGYPDKYPFINNLDTINPNYVSWEYVQAIKAVGNKY